MDAERTALLLDLETFMKEQQADTAVIFATLHALIRSHPYPELLLHLLEEQRDAYRNDALALPIPEEMLGAVDEGLREMIQAVVLPDA